MVTIDSVHRVIERRYVTTDVLPEALSAVLRLACGETSWRVRLTGLVDTVRTAFGVPYRPTVACTRREPYYREGRHCGVLLRAIRGYSQYGQ